MITRDKNGNLRWTKADDWREVPWCVLDVETTGLDPKIDRILQLAMVFFHKGVVTGSWCEIFNPECHIPRKLTELHSIGNEDVKNKPKFWDLACDIGGWAENYLIVAYNAPFDRAFVLQEYERIDERDFVRPFIDEWADPLIWIRDIDRYVKGSGRHKLEATTSRHGIQIAKAHSADADAEATGHLLWKIRDQIRPNSVEAFLGYQKQRAEAQERAYKAWKESKKQREQNINSDDFKD